MRPRWNYFRYKCLVHQNFKQHFWNEINCLTRRANGGYSMFSEVEHKATPVKGCLSPKARKIWFVFSHGYRLQAQEESTRQRFFHSILWTIKKSFWPITAETLECNVCKTVCIVGISYCLQLETILQTTENRPLQLNWDSGLFKCSVKLWVCPIKLKQW